MSLQGFRELLNSTANLEPNVLLASKYAAPADIADKHRALPKPWHVARIACRPSVQIEEGDNLALLLCLLAGLQQQAAVVEGKADDLLHPVHNVPVAQPAPGQTCRELSTRMFLNARGPIGMHRWNKRCSVSRVHLLASRSERLSLAGVSTTFCTCSQGTLSFPLPVYRVPTWKA